MAPASSPPMQNLMKIFVVFLTHIPIPIIDGQIPLNCYYKQTEQLDWLPLCSPSKKQVFSIIWTEDRTLKCISGWEAMLEPLSTVYYESYRCHLGEGGHCSTAVNKTLFPGAPGTPLELCFLFEVLQLYSFSKLFCLL